MELTHLETYCGNDDYVFVSYAHKDSARVLPLIHAMQRRGYRIWFDQGIEPATEFDDYIAERLLRASCVIFFLSNKSSDSPYCKMELNTAITNKKMILPIHLENFDIPAGIAMKLSIYQQLFYYKYLNIASLLDEIDASSKLLNCRNAVSSVEQSPVQKEILNDFDLCTAAAVRGDAQAQYTLGECFYFGRGVEQNYNYALQWFNNAAQQNYALAQFAIGVCFERGNGVDANINQAVGWMIRAAENKLADAQSWLGNYYLSKDNPNCREAVKWFNLAVRQGHPVAQYMLGLCTEKGLGITANIHSAVNWYYLSAKQGICEAQYRLGQIRYAGADGIRDYDEAAEYFRLAAEQDHVQAIEKLAKCYLKGLGVAEDIPKSVTLYETAAKMGGVDAMCILGVGHYKGTKIKKDLDLSFAYFSEAAKQNSAMAICALGYCYSLGIGVKKNMFTANDLFKRAEKMGVKKKDLKHIFS